MRAARPIEGEELYFAAAVISGEGRPGVGGRRQQGCLGIGAHRRVSRFAGLKSRADHLHSLAVGLFPRGERDQVHFVTLLVPPVTPPGGLKPRGEFVEDVVFPELAQVVGTQAGPAAMGAGKNESLNSSTPERECARLTFTNQLICGKGA